MQNCLAAVTVIEYFQDSPVKAVLAVLGLLKGREVALGGEAAVSPLVRLIPTIHLPVADANHSPLLVSELQTEVSAWAFISDSTETILEPLARKLGFRNALTVMCAAPPCCQGLVQEQVYHS